MHFDDDFVEEVAAGAWGDPPWVGSPKQAKAQEQEGCALTCSGLLVAMAIGFVLALVLLYLQNIPPS